MSADVVLAVEAAVQVVVAVALVATVAFVVEKESN